MPLPATRRRRAGGLHLAAGVAAVAATIPAAPRDGGAASGPPAVVAAAVAATEPAAAPTPTATPEAALPDRVAAALERELAGEGGDAGPTERALRRFYEARGFRPAWIGPRGPNERAMAVIAALRRADEDGLIPADYRPADAADWMTIESLPERLAELELGLSRALLDFAGDLRVGRLNPRSIDPELGVARPEDVDGAELLGAAAAAGDLPAFLARLAPGNPYYHRLRRELARYRAVEAEGGWPQVGPGPNLERGMTGERVAALRRRLAVAGDLDAPAGGAAEEGGARFDAAVEEAVRAFQRRHGLAADGVVGPRTRSALDVPVEDRIRQMVVNMERWRWMPADLGDRYVLVNLAGFALEVVEDGRVVLAMPVVVGRPYRSTPIFSDELTYLVTNPYWNIPHTIAVEDILPKARRDPGYLVERGIRVLAGRGRDTVELNPYGVDWARLGPDTFPFRLRQDPGATNALGRIKFMFPNKHQVYLHDTPDKYLFQRQVRAASSGCIRLADPIRFAEYLLRDHPRLGPGGVRAAIEDGETLDFRLDDPVPIHLTYSTAWVDEDGTVQFRDDIYGRDERLARALFPPEPQTTADAT